jgi:hypothetical protein
VAKTKNSNAAFFRRRKFGNHPVHAEVGGKDCHFRSKLEYRYAQYLQILKESGHIQEWDYETRVFDFKDQKIEHFLPDFMVEVSDSDREVHECKGFLQKYDLDRLKGLFEEYPEVKVTIIFAKKPKISVQKMNKLKRYCDRIITNGNTIFRQAGIM